MAQKIDEGIYWIGVKDSDSRDFHGINTTQGGSYNSCLILDDTPALIDTTNKKYLERYMESLKEITEPEKIRYIIINHAEPDHTGALKDILEICKDAKVVCTEKCKEFLVAMWNLEADYHIIDEGDELNLGKRTLRFIRDPMVHWPETMMTYSPHDKMLFSGDLFGTEIAHESLFADAADIDGFKKLTNDYFALVIRPVLATAKAAIDKAKKNEINILCPSHGPLYRDNDADRIVQRYEELCNAPEEKKVAVVYATIWHSSEKIAKKTAETFEKQGYKARLFDINHSNLVDIMSECMTSKIVVFGSITMIGCYHPMFDALIPLLKLLQQPGKKAGVFGTYGWVSCSMPKLKKRMEEDLSYNIVAELDLRFGPQDKKDFDKIEDFARKLMEE